MSNENIITPQSQPLLQPTRPDYKLSYTFLWFTKSAKSYRKELKIYDEWIDNNFRKKSSKILENQGNMINGLSWILIAVLTSAWSAIPPLWNDMPSWLTWTKLGMTHFGSEDWGNQAFITLVPLCSGSILHVSPKIIPQKKGRFIMNLIIKFLPVLLLILIWYLPHTYKLYRLAKAIEDKEYKKDVISIKKQKKNIKKEKLLNKINKLNDDSELNTS
ncbi:hypothetical protein SCORR_v1c04690 [Spiroplasma corruscae]|uniref:Uncharacterized protein n=1 Tax=Spiroplasma corruscae TaxID=216934 RepID=A0A222EPB6_9MOLU|nr:hypothetical protein [Spiroplasma corruscae]ASP28241.1 hypothetical protein SCORR_v1c04690 [Spiroplasma corruscae]